jgi:poly-gamma-glutamate synthesis protein (capsule biosynthesis protein)
MAGDFSLFLAGDALITRPWSAVDDPAFLRLIEEIRAADVSIVNLETVIHEFKGYAQHDSGGTYMASPPPIAAELKWAGFDMVAHANNHAFDYGSSAILETLQHTADARLVLAGSGRDLQAARSPQYFRCNGGVVALVAMASTFIPYGAASRSRPDMQGRPGVNPLALTRKERAIVVPPRAAEHIRNFGRFAGRRPGKLEGRSFKVGARFHVGASFGVEKGRRLGSESDRVANLAAIAEAAGRADVVVASIHAHNQGRWLREFAGDAIESGADVVFVHGPHEVRAVEMRNGKPIFYSMGDFAFEIEGIARFPAELYERYGLGDDALPADTFDGDEGRRPPYLRLREVFEGFVAVLSIAERRVRCIRLLPVDLQFDESGDRRGRPRIAAPEMGRRIIESVAALSRRYATSIRYDAKGNCGLVTID